MEMTMLKEQEIYDNVTVGSCHQCEHGILAEAKEEDVEMVFECTIVDIKQCPVVIHDMSL